MKTFLDRYAPSEPDKPAQKSKNAHTNWHQGVNKNYNGYIRTGIYFVVGFLAIFLIWSVFAPIRGAAFAQGRVVADGQNSIVQHFEGGILDQILVHEGERVYKGQNIARIEATQSQVETNRAQLLLASLDLQRVRLEAQRDLNASLSFPPIQNSNLKGEIEQIKARQLNEFYARKEQLDASLKVIDQRIAAINAQIAANDFSLDATYEELKLIEKELDKYEYLYSKNLIEESRIIELKRTKIQLEASLQSADSSTASSIAQLRELQEQVKEAKVNYQLEAASQLREVEVQIADAKEQLVAANDRLSRVNISAPKDGIIFRLPKKTIGGVISPGDIVAEILPTSEDLIIEAQLEAKDIDIVQVGQEAELRFSALSNRNPPIAYGKVEFISPDIVTEENGQTPPYYPVRVRIDEASWPEGVERNAVVPGMDVETFLITENRTILSYLIEPLISSASRALREP